MFSIRGEKIIDRIIEINILLLAFLMPIISIFFILTNFFVFENWATNDFFLVSFLTETVLLFFLIKILFFGLEIKKKALIYLMPFAVFILVLCLSAIFSQAPWHSFWGLKERQMGLITWLHYLVFFVIVIFTIKDQKQIRRILWAIITAAAIVCAYGFLQFIGLDFQRWEEEVYMTGRIFSTFGQPNFLASYLLLGFPGGGFSLIFSKKNAIRVGLICLSIAIVFCLIFTLSRGGWLGLVAEVLFFLIIYFWVKKHKNGLIIISVLLLSAIAVILILNLFFKPANLTSIYKGVTTGDYSPLVFLKDRIVGTIFFNQGSGSARLFWWSKGLKLFTERPILGYGLETQRYVFPYFYEPKVAIFQTINSYVDRAHNEIVDLLLVSGLSGLIIYVYLIIHILRLVFKDLKTNLDKYFSSENCLPLALLIGSFGCWLSHQFSFAVVSAGFYIWLFAALIGAIVLNREYEGKKFEFKAPLPLSIKICVIIIVVFLLSLFNWQHNVKFYLADHYFLRAVRAFNQGNWSVVLE
ncbi:MAG: O-antigen ligase family protein, partial [Patescibacteria group bacterium]